MVRPRVVLSESKIRTRKTPIYLSPEPLDICVQIFDLLSDASSAAPGVRHFDRGFEQPRVAGSACESSIHSAIEKGAAIRPFSVLFHRDAALASLGHGRNRHLIIVGIADTLALFQHNQPLAKKKNASQR